MNLEELKEIIRSKLDDYRYNHSLCVASEAKRLAHIYGENENDAYLAGLLHDITKNDTYEEHLLIFESFGIILSDVEKASPKLWHAISGSVYVKKILNINNSDLILAIRYHTTARKDMTPLEKIVYLADFTSADRNYPDVEIMRKLVNTNMDDAMLYSLSYTINSLTEKDSPIHPDTIDAYNQTVMNISQRGDIK